jgi:hypothetical protein
MSEQRTHDASGLLICQHCGAVLKTRSKNCRDCGGITSSYSPTVIPVLVINRRPATAPQHLKPENDPLIVERVVVRCKFNAAMTPRPQGFHGSRAFLSEGGGAPVQPDLPEPDSQNVSGNSAQIAAGASAQAGQSQPADFFAASAPASAAPTGISGEDGSPGGQSENVPPGNGQDASSGGVSPTSGLSENALQGSVPNPEGIVPRGNLLEEMGAFSGAVLGNGLAPSAVPFDSPPNGGQSKSASETQSGQHNPAQGSAPVQSDLKSPSANQLGAEGGKVVRQAHPSYMVADNFLLVVQDTDGQTISVTQTIEGPEQAPVFGLLPAPSSFNLAASQVMPDSSVSLSGYELSFHDANKEEEFSTTPDVDLSVNIDSRLAFEEGLSRVAALRLQGALGRTGVLGFENPSTTDDIRKKFTRKSNAAEEDSEMITAEEAIIEPPKVKERSVFKPKKVADVEPLKKVDPIGDIKPLKAKGNPLAMIGAVAGVLVVVCVMGFVGAQKLGFLSGESGGSAFNATAGSGSLPKQWHLVLTRQLDVQTIFQDFELDVNQSGSVISGRGRDAIGDFTITGEVSKDNKLTMQKQYDSAGYIWPILFSGQVAPANNGSIASGSFVWRKSDQERVQGDWQATVPQPINGAAPNANPM